MRRQLLALIHVKEFAKEAAFIDPCKAVVLRDVECDACGAVADVDVCHEVASADTGDTWRCRTCSAAFGTDDIERRLLARAAAAIQGWQTQDLRCARCRAVSTGGLRRECGDCGEALAHSVPPAALRGELGVLRSVARFHGLFLLDETVAGHLAAPSEGTIL
jgi:DNA polymerase epsilon subunit 1